MAAGASIGLVVGVIGTLAVRGKLLADFHPDWHTWLLIGIMFAAGLIGGGVNYFLAEGDAVTNLNIRRSMFVGIGAALLVPLFLQMLSSDLLKTAKDDNQKLLVFFGFCLIAAITSKTFIITLSENVMRQLREARENNERTQAIIDREREQGGTGGGRTGGNRVGGGSPPASARAFDMMPMLPPPPPPGLTEADRDVLIALGSSQYTFRSLIGIEGDVPELSAEEVARALDKLKARDLARSWRDEKGEAWYLTSEGRNLYSRLME